MINLLNINNKINSILNSVTLFGKKRAIDTKKLPSLGLFYKPDFSIKIRKAALQDIQEYNEKFEKSLLVVLNNVKTIIERNIILPVGYTIDDIRAIAMMYIFLEIVRWSMDRNDINVSIDGENIGFMSNFNYFQIPELYINDYTELENSFLVDGWRFSLPSIGIERSVTNFLITKEKMGTYEKYVDYNWNFMYFVHDKGELTIQEIDNLLVIFNDDMSDEDKEKIDDIIDTFSGFLRYHVNYKDKSVAIDNNIDLEHIWV